LKEKRAICYGCAWNKHKDLIEELYNLRGIPLVLIDTVFSGLRETNDLVGKTLWCERTDGRKQSMMKQILHPISFWIVTERSYRERYGTCPKKLPPDNTIYIVNKIDLMNKKITRCDIKESMSDNSVCSYSARKNMGLKVIGRGDL
jgi:tRNA U34 5-carboxymethylaminomethyl modifying GTPase MnmE/TrmE